MDISVENLQTKVLLNPPRIFKMTKTILHHEGVAQAVVAVVFVTRQRIQALNKKFLRRDYATDVLAFDFEGRAVSRRTGRRKPKALMGDIIISTDAAVKNAGIYGTSASRELALYVIHGILHLLGYDDRDPADIQRMRKREQELLEHLGGRVEKILR